MGFDKVKGETSIQIPAADAILQGDLSVPEGFCGCVLFAHGSGSSRQSPRNRYVARVLQDAGIATLLFDLLTADEEVTDRRTGHLRFDIGLLAERLLAATAWLHRQGQMGEVKLGYFGASTGAAAALVAASEAVKDIAAVVSRGGRPDLAGEALKKVQAPTLLIVGRNDSTVLQLNQQALLRIPGEKRLEIIPGATHLFEEPGTLEEAARLARDWFEAHLGHGENHSRAA